MTDINPTITTNTPASREALHALGNGIDQLRWKLYAAPTARTSRKNVLELIERRPR